MTPEPYRTSVDIAAPPEAVVPFLTRAEAIVAWMGDDAVLDAVPGGVFHLDINGVPVRGRYLELDPPHRLVVSWGHAGSELLPPEETAAHAIGSPHFLARLRLAARGEDPGPDASQNPEGKTSRRQLPRHSIHPDSCLRPSDGRPRP